jgi:uncharacterized protein YjiS (DUF1127 family)
MSAIARRLPRVGMLSSASVLRWCRRVYDAHSEWQTLARERESLAQLDDRLLTDIGLTREQQLLECSKLLWGISIASDRSPIRNCIDPNQNW